MTNPTPFDQRPSGIESVGALLWGSHFCLFYASPQELLDVLVPFMRAGLERSECCLWEIAAPLTLAEAKQALSQAVPNLAEYESRGQIEYVSPPWIFDADVRTDEALENRLDRAILAGFDGLRLACHAGSGKPGRAATAFAGTIRRLNVIAAVAYSRAEFGTAELLRVVQQHRCALICNSGQWEILEGSEVGTARDALERSEDKLRSLFKSMSEGFAYHRIVLDREGRPCDYIFLELSPAFERLTGLVAEQILGKRVTQVLPGIEADPADWIGRYGRVALTGEPVRFESYAAALDKWYAISAFSEQKGYFAVTFADVTERKRAEALQQAAEERLRVTLQSIGDAVIATDIEGRVTLMNRVAEALTGWSETEARGKLLREVFNIINEVTGAVAEDPVRKVIEQGGIVALANHTVLIARDGRRIAIADSAAPVLGDELLGVVLVFRDVSAARAAEEALRQSESRYRDLFQNMTEEFHFWKLEYDEQGRIKTWRMVDANPPTLKTWGKTLEEIRGKTTDEIFGSGATLHYMAVVQKIMTEGVPHSYEDYFPNLDKYFRFTSIPLGDHFITTGADITDIRKAMAQIEEANARLQEADQRKNEFLAMLSHELRNPLTPIRNSLYILDRTSPGSEQAKRAKEVIDRQTGQLARLVDDLLDVTRISRNKIQLQRSQLDLNDLIRRTVDDHRSSFEQQGVHLEAILASERLSIDGDEARLTQVVGNLLHNAVKFTPAGGRVTVRTAHVAARGRASLWVIDTGRGMEPAMQRQLFQPFMQGDATLDRSQGGLGLGLALVKGLVELHGGEVCGHSDGPGKGAQFVVELPLDQAAAMQAGSMAANQGKRSRRVLIIEDNVDAANSLREALELGEHIVEVAYNGPDGLTRARAFKPEITLCDIGLPGMDGYEVARRFRADEALRNIFLVALSGYALPEDLQLAWEAGFSKHIAKPPSLEQLEELFTDAVRSR